jgi:hypothetical protein
VSSFEIEDGALVTVDGLGFAARLVGYGIVGVTKIREIEPYLRPDVEVEPYSCRDVSILNQLQAKLEQARHEEPDQHYQLHPMYVLMDLWEPR